MEHESGKEKQQEKQEIANYNTFIDDAQAKETTNEQENVQNNQPVSQIVNIDENQANKEQQPLQQHEQTQEDEDLLSLDAVIQQIGFSWYQLRIFTIMGLIAIAEGSQISALTLMIPILQKEWNVSNYSNSLQASLIFISILIGSVVSGYISDKRGRKEPILYSLFFMTFFATCSAFAKDFTQLVLFRFCMGILVGFFGPLAMTVLAEITPASVRGRYMSILSISLGLGQMYGTLIGYFVLDDFQSGNWKLLLIFCAIPAAISFFLSLACLDEPARFEIFKQNYDVGFDILKRMMMTNKLTDEQQNQILSEENKVKIIRWSQEIIKQNNQQSDNLSQNQDEVNQTLLPKKKKKRSLIRQLFEGDGRVITPILWTNWFNSSFIYYGIVVFMPYIINKIQNKESQKSSANKVNMIDLAISNGVEIISILISSFLIEYKYFGRKYSMILFYLLSSGFCCYTYYLKEEYFLINASIAKFFIAITFNFVFQYTSEAYPTKVRTSGLGLGYGFGRLGGIIMPWACILLVGIDLFLPFIAFASLSLFSCITSILLPYDTTGRELDIIKVKKRKQSENSQQLQEKDQNLQEKKNAENNL